MIILIFWSLESSKQNHIYKSNGFHIMQGQTQQNFICIYLEKIYEKLIKKYLIFGVIQEKLRRKIKVRNDISSNLFLCSKI
ncbi:unnamed protein product [Paramecium primaurelia]|uniref:Uncharacterized protein n=1 Tax=Paramecium primaurelia TaxID=5886 RepID=A0A8S1QPP2_PARPR|nr:unnamed protein product [Paramecium primaurelia]